ncbi:MAG: TetR/AcrR family transcriptional regulator [Acidimicrobiia bacterium]|nr:TetR/AcrR family transcriptional regulator [Acidimicrobiia bacterium]
MAHQQARAQATRLKILEAAAAAFARNGLGGTSLNALVRESGLTKGAFYFHFDSKEDLALAAFRLKQEQLVAGMQAAVPADADALETLVAMLRARVRLLEEDRSLRCVLTLGQELRVDADPTDQYAGFQELALGTFTDLIARGRGDGSIRDDIDPPRYAWLAFAALIGMDALSELMTGGKDLEARNEDLIELLEGALGPRRHHL